MKSLIHLKIITPNGLFWEDDVSIVTLKTTGGYIGLQVNHAPLIAPLEIALIMIGFEKSNQQKIAAISGGIVYCQKTLITIVTEAIEFKDQIDLKRAKISLENAKAKLTDKTLGLDQQVLYNIKLQKALNRIKLSQGN